MKTLLKIFIFLIANSIGFVSISLVFHHAQESGLFIDVTDPLIISSFFQNAMFAWAAGAIISVGFFVISGVMKYVFLAAPFIAVILYWLKLVFLTS